MKISLEQFGYRINRFADDLNKATNEAMIDAARRSVPVVKAELRAAETTDGSFPLIASKNLYGSTKWKLVSGMPKGKRTAAEVGVYVRYAAAMEFGTAPHTPPLAPLVEWARHKRAILQRKATVGRRRGSSIVSSERGSRGNGAPAKARRPPKANRADMAMAYFVQQKIRRKGIKPRFYMAKSMDKIGVKVMSALRKHTKKLKDKYPVRIVVRKVI